jgi:hypothetical protein
MEGLSQMTSTFVRGQPMPKVLKIINSHLSVCFRNDKVTFILVALASMESR